MLIQSSRLPVEPADERQTLLGFARHVLGVDLYDGTREFTDWQGRPVSPDWQGEPFVWFENPGRVTRGTMVAPNGSGKTSKITGPLNLAYAALHNRATGIIMVPDGTQLDQQVWPALLEYRHKLPPTWDWKYRHITSPTGSRIIGRAVDDPNRAEGFHKFNDLDGPLLITVEEAKSMAADIFDGLDKCTYNGLFYISSAGVMRGTFYDSHTRLARQFLRRRAGLVDCPHISRARIEAIINKHGADDPFTRATLFAEFMPTEDGEHVAVKLLALQICLASPPPPDPRGGRVAFCDFAGGGDENTLTLRTGNIITTEAAWRDPDEMRAIGRFQQEFRRLRLRPEEIWGDADGAGKVMCARFDEVGWPINRYHGGAEATDKDYFNLNSQVWHEGGKDIERQKWILPHDPVLEGQLTTRRTIYRSDGKIQIEPKEKLRARGVESPDRADGALAVMHLQPKVETDPWGRPVDRMERWRPRETAESFERLPGGDW